MSTILVRNLAAILFSSGSGHELRTSCVWRINHGYCLLKRRPHTWYPLARKKKRSVFLHVGPTNSGKTYHALKQLELSSSGIYCGPLRLLAWEVAERLNKANVPCSLITGQEREEIDGAKHVAMTVEMADVSCEYKCAVIDEIQMIACKTRGFSFTRALLGIPADELHLCGEPAVVSLIQEMLSVTGDIMQVEYYKRLSPLIPSERPLDSFSEIRTGDCVVAFSRQNIYYIKKKIEAKGEHLCSIVYGSLPPETRTRQAKIFNDSTTEFDVLVASDAIGMGLNLNIRRIIFSTLKKYDGIGTRDLTIPEIKQIAGRAGRYGSLFPNGEVTCMLEEDLCKIHSALKATSSCLKAAGLFPTFDILALYSRQHPKCTFYSLLEQFVEKAKLSSHYFLSDCESIMNAAAMVEDLPLGLHERYIFCISPVDVKDDISAQGLIQFAEAYAKKGLVHLHQIFTPETLRVPKSYEELMELESIFKVLDLYVWLGFHFKESFPDYEVASSQKALCAMLIEEYLERLGWKKHKRRSNQSKISFKQKLLLQM
ncbi:ATP-dependent RNA helicase SUV3, mitochondrial isoform X2 [Cryptomeria japonica]|uniref:ATP-dependent RNA helicase SUV3, mitochondrial isoform X2 n=1 Tax=Cryptomeria japonica TaxID=3369 RepID=UPI0027DA1AEF|nr:ATP-dependent RNA helicase SUV3, mitochondrial isoform X2 [Cryptomeria japonica]